MRVLVVKLTSMGDVLHLMPALSDLQKQHPDATVDWMVEDSFAEIPAWHPIVQRVIQVSTRRWRSLAFSNIREFLTFLKELRAQPYDVVIDAQGLIKSAVFSRFARLAPNGLRAGFSGDSIKESPAAYWYQKKVLVDRQQHAIKRLRALFAGVFDYTQPQTEVDYQLDLGALSASLAALTNKNAGPDVTSSQTSNLKPSIMLLHGTTWPTKHLPEKVWGELADLIGGEGYDVTVCWGNQQERLRAERIANGRPHVSILPKSSLSDLAITLSKTLGVIAVDTGLGHLAAALSVPMVSLYGSTNSQLTGAVGKNQIHIQTDYPCSPCLLKTCNKLTEQVSSPPCYQSVSSATIWQALYDQIV